MGITLNVHSIESFATLEGAGIRYALFLQGCPYRCVYCHNPDTWKCGIGKPKTVDSIIEQMQHYKSFYKNGGGLTVTGGEPLMQSEGVLEFFKRVHSELGLTNTIDTSCAVMPDNINEILHYTDLVIVDLKFHNNQDYKHYADGSLDNTIAMLDKTLQSGVKVLVRTVVVPDINDTFEDIDKYVEIVNKYPNVIKYELLGYHTMGVFKYNELGIKYRLDGVEPLSVTKLKELQNYANSKLKI